MENLKLFKDFTLSKYILIEFNNGEKILIDTFMGEPIDSIESKLNFVAVDFAELSGDEMTLVLANVPEEDFQLI